MRVWYPNERIRELERKAEMLQTNMNIKDAIVAGTKAANDELHKKIEKLEQENERLKGEVVELQRKIEVIHREHNKEIVTLLGGRV